MHRRIAALAIAFLAAVGCDSENGDAAPAEGSCQALVDEVWMNEDLDATVRNLENFGFEPRDLANAIHEQLSVPEPPEPPMVEGLAYQVAYRALCEEYGADAAAGYCDVSQTLGCEG